MRLFITILIFFYSVTSFGQQNIDNSHLGHRKESLSLYSLFNVNNYYHIFQDEKLQYLQDEYNQREFYKASVGLGWIYDFSLNEKISVGTGVIYSDKGNQYKGMIYLILGNILTIDSNGIKADYSGQGTIKKRYQYITVPVYLYYSLAKNFLSPSVFIGFSNNFLFSVTEIVKLTDNGTKIRSGYKINSALLTNYFRDYNIYNISIKIGFIFEEYISDNINLTIRPVFEYFIIPLSNFPSKKYLYSFGIGVGLKFKDIKL